MIFREIADIFRAAKDKPSFDGRFSNGIFYRFVNENPRWFRIWFYDIVEIIPEPEFKAGKIEIPGEEATFKEQTALWRILMWASSILYSRKVNAVSGTDFVMWLCESEARTIGKSYLGKPWLSVQEARRGLQKLSGIQTHDALLEAFLKASESVILEFNQKMEALRLQFPNEYAGSSVVDTLKKSSRSRKTKRN
jgi:hypothetical protein